MGQYRDPPEDAQNDSHTAACTSPQLHNHPTMRKSVGDEVGIAQALQLA
jgi:hypothetical protein